MKGVSAFHRGVVALLLVYLFLPLAVTFLYSLARVWSASLLPDEWTLQWYAELFTDPRFLRAAWNTVWVTGVSVVLCLAVLLPVMFFVHVDLPRWERVLQGLAILPYAIPGVVFAVGLLRLYASGPLALSGSVWLLIGAYCVAVLPYMYQGIHNSLRAVNAVQLVEAAELLGASKMRALVHVILPNVLPGVLVAVLLSVSVLFGEFVLANLLVGGHFETIQIYLYQQLNKNGHVASAVVIIHFLITLLISWWVLRLGNQWKASGGGQEEGRP